MTIQPDTNAEQRGCLGEAGRVLGRLYAGAVTIYALVTLVLLVIGVLLHDRTRWVGMIQSVIELLILPSLALLPLSLLLRRWRLVLLLLPVGVAFLLLFGEFFLPRSSEVGPTDTVISVLTFNLEAPGENEMQSLVDILRAANADLVALQELTPAAAQCFEAELSDRYPHQALHPSGGSSTGQGILSRYPITADARLDALPPLAHQRVEIELNGQPVVVYNTHPVPPFSSSGFQVEKHRQAVEALLARAESETGPVLLVGDFNMTDQFQIYDVITQNYTDLYRDVGEVGLGFTYPANWGILIPLLRLDYVFAGPAFTALSARVWPDYGSSDHHPLFARVALAAPAAQPDDGS